MFRRVWGCSEVLEEFYGILQGFEKVLGDFGRLWETLGVFVRVSGSLGQFWESLGEFWRVM